MECTFIVIFVYLYKADKTDNGFQSHKNYLICQFLQMKFLYYYHVQLSILGNIDNIHTSTICS